MCHTTNQRQQLKREQKYAFIAVWAVVTLISMGAFVFLLVADNQTVFNYSPTCISVSEHYTECFFCGMTRAFISLKGGNMPQAYAFNQASIALLAFIIINFCLSISCLIFYLKNKQRC